MRIFYLSSACSEKMYSQLFLEEKIKPGQQVQKYHRLFARGFVLNRCDVNMITALPLTRKNYQKIWFHGKGEWVKGLKYTYLSLLNIPILKHIGIIEQTVRTLLKNGDSGSVIICDVLNQSVAVGGIIASRILKCQCIGIVTDLPDMLAGSHKSLGTRFNNWVLGKYTDYVFLTEQMNTRINVHHRPYVVLEGHVDSEMDHIQAKTKYNNFVCMYAGALSKKYGLDNLVEGFLEADFSDAELHLYGDGDYVSELVKICEKNDNVKYFGTKLNEYIVKEEQKVSLLVNPRPTVEEFTKYSFPSKNMEYMLTGTPVLTTKLPGMPKEYYPYVFLLEDETKKGVTNKLKELYGLDPTELQKKGKHARQFVLEEKSNIRQAYRVIRQLFNVT